MAGENLPLVGKLLGHRRHRTTAGYAHLADAHLVEAAEKVGWIIAEAMEIPTPGSATLHQPTSLTERPSIDQNSEWINQRGQVTEADQPKYSRKGIQ